MQLITVKELSKIIKVKGSTLYAWANKGLIPCHKLNNLLRFDLDEIKTWIKESEYIPEQVPNVAAKRANPSDIDSLVRNAIDTTKRKRYTQTSGKPDCNQGLGKEA